MAVDVDKWLRENMSALNLSDEEKKIAEKLASGEFGKRLGANVYPQEAVSGLQSSLDRMKADKTELETANIAWQETYLRDLSGEGTQTALQKLQAAGFDVTGLQPSARGGVTNTDTGVTLSRAEIEKLVREEASKMIEPVRQTSLEFAEFAATVAPEYRSEYGKRFDAAAFRKFAFEHRGEVANLQQAYDLYTADERKAKEEDSKKKWEENKEKEIELRVMSRLQIPEISPESGAGGPFDIAGKSSPAAASTASGAAGAGAASGQVSREQNRQEFAKKYRDLDLTGL